MHAAPLPSPKPNPRDADRVLRCAAAIVTAYLLIATVPLAAYTLRTGSGAPLALHGLIFTVAGAAALVPRHMPRALLDGFLLVIAPLMYVELRWLIPGAGYAHRDALVRSWDVALWHTDPSRTLAPRFHGVVLSELLHLAYASYYALVYIPPIVLYVRGRRDHYARTMLALTLAYTFCFAAYVLFPVDGPRFVAGPAAAPDGPIRSIVLWLLDLASSRGTAFPSSHVAAAVTATVFAVRYQPRLGAAVGCATVLLTAATVYGGFHYGVDALAGLVAGSGASIAGAWLGRWSDGTGAHRATAAWI